MQKRERTILVKDKLGEFSGDPTYQREIHIPINTWLVNDLVDGEYVCLLLTDSMKLIILAGDGSQIIDMGNGDIIGQFETKADWEKTKYETYINSTFKRALLDLITPKEVDEYYNFNIWTNPNTQKHIEDAITTEDIELKDIPLRSIRLMKFSELEEVFRQRAVYKRFEELAKL